jgi:four helix bundle protein
MQEFRKLGVWKKAHELALFTYRITNDFPRDEVFGLRNMMRKTSSDIPAIVAEGAASNIRRSLHILSTSLSGFLTGLNTT